MLHMKIFYRIINIQLENLSTAAGWESHLKDFPVEKALMDTNLKRIMADTLSQGPIGL